MDDKFEEVRKDVHDNEVEIGNLKKKHESLGQELFKTRKVFEDQKKNEEDRVSSIL